MSPKALSRWRILLLLVTLIAFVRFFSFFSPAPVAIRRKPVEAEKSFVLRDGVRKIMDSENPTEADAINITCTEARKLLEILPQSPPSLLRSTRANAVVEREELNQLFEAFGTVKSTDVIDQQAIGKMLEILKRKNKFSFSYRGRGMVTAGSVEHMPQILATIRWMREKLEIKLPIEIWKNEFERMPVSLVDYAAKLGADIRSILVPTENKYLIKPLALLSSQFNEIIFFDSDSVPLVNIEFLFAERESKNVSVILWPDYWTLNNNASIWNHVKYPVRDATTNISAAVESGLIVLCKYCGALDMLIIATYMNYHDKAYYASIYDSGHSSCGKGDKDTFLVASIILNTSYYMVPVPVRMIGQVLYSLNDMKVCGHSMGQHWNDRIILLHHNGHKWSWSDWASGYLVEIGLFVTHTAELADRQHANHADCMDMTEMAYIFNIGRYGVQRCVWYNQYYSQISRLSAKIEYNFEEEFLPILVSTYSKLCVKGSVCRY